MAFTGYVFKSKEDIEPFAERSDVGVTFKWAEKHAKRLSCTVICGYVEIEEQDHERERIVVLKLFTLIFNTYKLAPKLYNSMIMVNPDGQLVCNTRKVCKSSPFIDKVNQFAACRLFSMKRTSRGRHQEMVLNHYIVPLYKSTSLLEFAWISTHTTSRLLLTNMSSVITW